MKLLRTISFVIMVAVVFILGACDKSTPAEQFVVALNKLTVQLKNVDTSEDYIKFQEGVQAADKIIVENADYELTDKEREAIKEAMKQFFTATFTKVGELQNEIMPKAQIDFMANMISGLVDNAKTLGELNGPMEGNDGWDDDEEIVEISSESVTGDNE